MSLQEKVKKQSEIPARGKIRRSNRSNAEMQKCSELLLRKTHEFQFKKL